MQPSLKVTLSTGNINILNLEGNRPFFSFLSRSIGSPPTGFINSCSFCSTSFFLNLSPSIYKADLLAKCSTATAAFSALKSAIKTSNLSLALEASSLKSADSSPLEIKQEILSDFETHLEGESVKDDVTIIVIKAI